MELSYDLPNCDKCGATLSNHSTICPECDYDPGIQTQLAPGVEPKRQYSIVCGMLVGVVGGGLGILSLALQWPTIAKTGAAFVVGYLLRQLLRVPGASTVLGVIGVIPGAIVGICLMYWIIITAKLI